MSKKAKEVMEAAPKYKQPWQGFLSLSAILLISYVAYWWFLNPVSGFLTKMVQANAYVLFTYFQSAYSFGSLAFIFALNNSAEMNIYPQGYLVNWVAYFVLGIVWFISIWMHSYSFTPSKRRIGKQPWAGLIVLILSLVLAFVMWEILIIVFKLMAYDVIMLGVIGFAVFPIWVNQFMYWPFIPKRPQTHPIIRGAIYTVISWVIAFIIYWIALGRMALGSLTTVYSQQYASSLAGGTFLYGVPLTIIQPTEPWDFVISLFFALIFGNTMMQLISPFQNMSQPKRGLINWGIGIIIALILWVILAVTVAPTSVAELVTTTYSVLGVPYLTLLPVPVTAHVNITLVLVPIIVVLLFGQLTFEMWPWKKWGIKGRIAFVIIAFIIGYIIFFVMTTTGLAGALTGANQITAASGIQTYYLSFWLAGLQAQAISIPLATDLMWNYSILAAYFEGSFAVVGNNILITWMGTTLIFYILIYEGFGHWPWK
jgi:hypothetical protein